MLEIKVSNVAMFGIAVELQCWVISKNREIAVVMFTQYAGLQLDKK